MRRLPLLLLSVLTMAAALGRAASPAGEALWQRLHSGNAVVLMRHAATDPGIGDPPGFVLDNCATQRNLSGEGRRAASAVGAVFRQRGLEPVAWSSRWCRCLDTARLAFGQVRPESALDSMFNDSAEQTAAKLRDLRARLAARLPGKPLVLVTHDVNIRALTGQALAPGELLLTRLRKGKLEVLGRLPVDLQAVAQTPRPESPPPCTGSTAYNRPSCTRNGRMP